MIPLEFSDIGSDSDSGEIVVGIGEELNEVDGEVGGVDELVDEAAAADAELECGGGVLFAAGVVGAPLDVEADGEAVAVEGADVADPLGDGGGVARDGGVNDVAGEGDVIRGGGVVAVAVDGHLK